MTRALRSGAAVCLLALVLAGCGGGGGGGGSGSTTPEPTPLPPVAADLSPVAARDGGSALPAQWQGGAFMQIFVRSYQDSDGDGIGDLRGLIQRLDYLQDLGVKGLWLMPIGPSQDRDHGYAVTDYRAVEPRYGTLADFDELLRQAHARGIGVIVDYVINHSAAQHPLFVHAGTWPTSPVRDWYLWQQISKPAGWSIYGSDPWRRHPAGGWYFAAFWDQMPDFDLRNPEVVRWHHDNLRFWLNRGVDGFRFDAVGHLVENGPGAWDNQPENLTLLRAVRDEVLGAYARRYLVCEGPGAPLAYQSACGSAFAFGHHARVLQAARGDVAAIAAVADHFRSAPLGMATLLANHDSFAGQRVHDQLGGNLAQYRLAAATYLLMPGTPFIYYGEEIGMAGAASLSGDPKLRTPMSWSGDVRHAGFTTGIPYRALSANVTTMNVAAQQADPASLLSFYRAMLALRNGLAPLARGSWEAARQEGQVLSFQRALDGERVLVAINYGSSAAQARVSGLAASARLESRFPSGAADLAADAAGALGIDLPAQSLRVFVVREP
ncbi:MAG: alpha-amylase [Burkholderiaceae bacterium]|nr:alpha-amylase [Burkholderiaceae bacterium]